jgi:hypothetical protein
LLYDRIDKMATEIYKKDKIQLIDGTSIEIVPLKIKYLREFMLFFEDIDSKRTDEESIDHLLKCAQIAMKQYRPELAGRPEDVADNLDIHNLYKLIGVAANIKVNKKSTEPVKEQAQKSGKKWSELDLASLESEVFLLGIWKDYEELELSLSMPELMATLESKRESDYQDKKFAAAMQGVDLYAQSGQSKGQKEWEDMKARVFSKGQATDSNDILALQGENAKKVGFGIGMGLDYDDMRDPSVMKS